VQRKRLAAVWGFEIRQPVTEVDNCNIADVLFISQIYNFKLEIKHNSEQKLRLPTSSPNCSKPNVACWLSFYVSLFHFGSRPKIFRCLSNSVFSTSLGQSLFFKS
jgi:hypothetical protein